MADIFPKQSVWGCKFFSGIAENASLLGCYAMYGPSGMRVEVIPEDEESIFLQKINNKSPDYMASQHRTQPESIQQTSQMSIVNLSV